MAEGPDGHCIYVGGLHPMIDLQHFIYVFSQYGVVRTAALNRRRRFGLVSYRHKRATLNTIKYMNGLTLMGSPMRVEWAYGYPKEESDESDTEPRLAFLRALPEFQRIQQNRHLLEGMLRHFSRNNPRLLLLIAQNSEEFMRMLNEPRETASAQPVVAGASPLESSLREVSPQDREGLQSEPDIHYSSSGFRHRYNSVGPILQDAFDIVMSRTTPNNRTVYVGGLKSYVTENVIRSNFSEYGDIEEVSLFHNYGFIRLAQKYLQLLLFVLVINTTFMRVKFDAIGRLLNQWKQLPLLLLLLIEFRSSDLEPDIRYTVLLLHLCQNPLNLIVQQMPKKLKSKRKLK
ncbi:hypothetical protein JTE90_019716 [Oedothorax gibbosus]|uniref:RRM domain-containing protein n=1 Tax=Oedothorax gibbosus TaxID=931172 RepID=A0AAV6TV84_9ARAC|nr:hypothetical protein JTE90_019716 [Oedothorax gibbosus]